MHKYLHLETDMTHIEQILKLAKTKSVICGRDLETSGIPRQYLQRLYRRGQLERVGRGLYVLPNADITERHTIVQAALAVPHGIVCLLSALRFHELTTQAPFKVWVAIWKNARPPRASTIPIHFVFVSGAAFDAGVEVHRVEGAKIRVYSMAKTVADCFKFRNQIGIDVAIEALHDYKKHPNFDIDLLWKYSNICRVANVIRPYLEASL